MRNRRSPIFCLVAATLLTAICFAEAPDRITGTIDSSRMVPLGFQIQRQAKPEYDQGRVDASFQLTNVKLFLVPSPSQVRALKQLLEEQQDPKSPNFHKWLTVEQYADLFGMSTNDIKKTTAWLKSQGLTVGNVANGRNWINFSGTASQVEAAFHTEIHRYNVKGEMHFANSTPPSIPAALSGIANGFMGLDDFRPKSMIRKAVPRTRGVRPNYYDANTGDGNFLGPGDIATIYDLTPLYNNGIDGTGEKLAIMGQTDLYLADLVNFRSGFSLPAIYSGCTANGSGVLSSCTTSSSANFQYILDPNGGGDPGVSTNDLSEADLDLEWSAATAPGAQIIFYNSTNVFTSLLDAIDTSPVLAPVISLSYGNCEWNLGGALLTSSGPGQLEAGMMQAAAAGITILNSSGDSGAAECDGGATLATGGLAVSYPASSPEVTGVGGTAIPYADLTTSASTYWNTSSEANGDSAKSGVLFPEIAWNEDEELASSFGNNQLYWQTSGYIISVGGGGVSNCALQNDPTDTLCVSGFPVPTWQSGLSFPTAPPTTGRYSPDVSLLASPDFPGYVYCTAIEELATGTTDDTDPASSCGSGGPTGITTAVNGSPVGGNPYVIAPSIVGGTSASAPIFAGIITMLNQFVNGANSPGLGPINSKLYSLAANSSSKNAFHQVKSGNNVVYCSGGTPNYEFNSAYVCPAVTGSDPNPSFGWQASNADATTGYNLVTGLGSIDANNLFTAWTATTTTGSFTLSLGGSSSLQVTPGTSGTATIDVNASGGFNSPLTFTCSDPSVTATGALACTVSPNTATNALSVAVTIPTAAPSAQLRPPASGRGIFYAALLPGLFGIVFTAGSRKRSARGLRFLSLIVMLGLSTLWLGACSSNSNSTQSGGTPPGTYTATVTATGGANPVTLQITLTVTQ